MSRVYDRFSHRRRFGAQRRLMYRKGTNQYIAKHKLGLKPEVQRDVWMLITFIAVVVLGGREWTHAHPVISPIPEAYASAPVPTPTPTPVPEPSAENIIAYIAKTFAPEGTAVMVKAIECFYSESGLRTNAYNFNSNGTDDRGVAQINSVHRMSAGDAHNFTKNIDKAYAIYKSRGNNFSAWYGRGCK